MTETDLPVQVRDDEIIVTRRGSRFVYRNSEDQHQLVVKGTPLGNYDFLARAWQAASDKARELGCIA